MAFSKLARLAFLFVVCTSMFCSAQGIAGANYSTAVSGFAVTDGTANCLAGKNSCWIQISTSTPNLQHISIASDATTYGLDAGGNIWSLPLHSHVWQSLALSPMTELAVVSSNNIYGLKADSHCAAPLLGIYQYTGGTDFEALGYCAVHIGAALDGTMYRIYSNGNVSVLTGTTWTNIPSAGGNGTPVKLAVGSANNVWLITSTGVIKKLDYAGTGKFVVVPGWASDIATNGDPVAGTELTFVLGTNNGLNNVYKYSSSTGALNGTWEVVNGYLNQIATGGFLFTMGIQTPNGSVFHLNTALISASGQTSGSFDCSVRVQGCPAGSVHTATTTVSWESGGSKNNNSVSGTPATFLNAAAAALTQDCDPVFGDPNSPECKISIQGEVVCSMMGVITTTFLEQRIEVAFTLAKYPIGGTYDSCLLTGDNPPVLRCHFHTDDWCTEATTPPDAPITAVQDDADKVFQPTYWNIWKICIRPFSSGPWTCNPVNLHNAERLPNGAGGLSDNFPKAACTHNP